MQLKEIIAAKARRFTSEGFYNYTGSTSTRTYTQKAKTTKPRAPPVLQRTDTSAVVGVKHDVAITNSTETVNGNNETLQKDLCNFRSYDT